MTEPHETPKPEFEWEFEFDAKKMTQDEFARQYPHPFLIQRASESEGTAALSYATQIGIPVIKPGQEPKTSSQPTHQDRGRVYRVVKRKGMPFDHMITVGRAGNNDIQLASPTVSKFHAYFQRDPGGGFTLTDAGSTNGSKVNGTALAQSQKVSLNDGDWLLLGKDVHLVFREPKGFHALLRGK